MGAVLKTVALVLALAALGFGFAVLRWGDPRNWFAEKPSEAEKAQNEARRRAFMEDEERNRVVAGADITVDASRFVEDYRTNEVAADTKYKGRIVETSATLHAVTNETDRDGRPMAVVQFSPAIYCGVISDLDREEWAYVRVGETITIRGVMIGVKKDLNGPILSSCIITRGDIDTINAIELARLRKEMCDCEYGSCAAEVYGRVNDWKAKTAKDGPSRKARDVADLLKQIDACKARATH